MTVTINGSGAIVGSDRAESGVNDDITSLAGNAATATTATKLSTATGDAPSYSCRAWVNFNGTGTVAIRASGNVSSITDNTTGDYTVNFITAMPDANFSCTASTGNPTMAGTTFANQITNCGRQTTAGFRILNVAAGAGADSEQVSAVAFR